MVKGRTSGTALDYMMGQGRNAIYLASLGWQVTGIDISGAGLKQAREAAEARKLHIETIDADANQWDFGVDQWDFRRHDLQELLQRPRSRAAQKGPAARGNGCRGGVCGGGPGKFRGLFAEGFRIVHDSVAEDIPDWAPRSARPHRRSCSASQRSGVMGAHPDVARRGAVLRLRVRFRSMYPTAARVTASPRGPARSRRIQAGSAGGTRANSQRSRAGGGEGHARGRCSGRSGAGSASVSLPGITADTGFLIGVERSKSRALALLQSSRLRRRRIVVLRCCAHGMVARQFAPGPRPQGVHGRANDRAAREIAGEAIAAIPGATVVDAIVMASAASRGDVVYTSDFDDLARLREHFRAVRILSV